MKSVFHFEKKQKVNYLIPYIVLLLSLLLGIVHASSVKMLQFNGMAVIHKNPKVVFSNVMITDNETELPETNSLEESDEKATEELQKEEDSLEEVSPEKNPQAEEPFTEESQTEKSFTEESALEAAPLAEKSREESVEAAFFKETSLDIDAPIDMPIESCVVSEDGETLTFTVDYDGSKDSGSILIQIYNSGNAPIILDNLDVSSGTPEGIRINWPTDFVGGRMEPGQHSDYYEIQVDMTGVAAPLGTYTFSARLNCQETT